MTHLFRSKSLLFILPFLCAVIFIGCVKKKEVVYSFSYTGSPYKDKIIHFRNTSSGADKFYWSFGDGTIGSGARPDHTYNNGGIYHVSLVINDDTLHTIKNDVPIGYDSTIMTLLVSTRSYSHSSVGQDSTYPPTHYTYPDTTMTIKEINPATISFGDELFCFSSFSAGILKFTGTVTDKDHSNLSYDIMNDRISYDHYLMASGRYYFTDYKKSK